jgi:Domain of unknown function (DUF4336)
MAKKQTMQEFPSGDPATYPPLDVLKPVAEGVWVVDSGPHRVLGLSLPIRMTLIRLANGDLLLHSPTRFDPALRRDMERHGRIRHLVAPSSGHWSFVQEWRQACPDVVTWAAPGLRDRAPVRRSAVRFDRDLGGEAPVEWSGEIEQALIAGIGFREVAFLHRPTGTLVLTDLMMNLEPGTLPRLVRPAAQLIGLAGSNGKPPLHVRLAIAPRRREARQAAQRLVAWAPARVVFSHGRWFEHDGTAALRRSLAWLLH